MIKDWNEVKRIQEINRGILDEVVRVCEKYKICYYLDCGALLGAVRHQAFIPWDDDVDISFTRMEYEKFEKAAKREWDGTNFLLHRPEDFRNDKWLDFIVRVVNQKETVDVNTYEKAGLEAAADIWGKPGIDVFILDCIPDDPKYQKRICREITLYYGLAMGHRSIIDYKEYSGFQKAVVWLLSRFGKLLSMKTILKKYHACCTRFWDCSGSFYFYSNFSMKDIWKRNKREWYQAGAEVFIDGKPYNAPVNYHEVLKMNYGDYMKLPPESERFMKHRKASQEEKK